MPWVMHATGTVAPGGIVVTTGLTVENQSFLIDFPAFSEGVVRRFGTLWWRRRNASPADAITAQQQFWLIWHNGTQVRISQPGTGGAIVFQTFKKFGAPLLIRIWRFDP